MEATELIGEDSPLHPQIRVLTRRLRDLHKALIDVETQYFGNVGSPLEHLQLVANHFHFAWLQKLSSVMTAFDERLDQEELLSVGELADFRTAIEMLIGPVEPGDAEFRKKYLALLHDAPEVVMAHGAVRTILNGLPKRAA